LCRAAGMVDVGVIAVDGTKVHANASNMANRDYRQIALRSSRRPAGSTVKRTSSMARSAGMSCPSISAPPKGVTGEEEQQLELVGGQRDVHVVDEHASGARVDLDPAVSNR